MKVAITSVATISGAEKTIGLSKQPKSIANYVGNTMQQPDENELYEAVRMAGSIEVLKVSEIEVGFS